MDAIKESDIEDNLKKHYEYIRRHLDWKDLVIYYKLFTIGEKDDIKSKGKTDHKEATELALDKILNSNIPNRFSALVEALREAGFKKTVDILLGEGVPMNEFHRMIIGDCEKTIRESLNPMDVLHLLVSKDVLRNSDAEVIRTRDRMEGHGEANFELMTCLPKRNREWYKFFVEALKESKYDNLVQIIEARASREAQHDGVVVMSVIDRQSSSNSMSAEETKEETKVSECKHKNCERTDFYCLKHKTRFCQNCSPHKECPVHDLAHEDKKDPEELENESKTVSELCKYIQACIIWRADYRKDIVIQANTLITEVREERAKFEKKMTDLEISIDLLKSKACKTLDEETDMLEEEMKKLTRLQETRQLKYRKTKSFDTIINDIELKFALEQVNSILTTYENAGYPGKIMVEGESIRGIIQNLDETRCIIKEFIQPQNIFNVPKEVGCCLVSHNRVALCDREEIKLRIYQNRMLVNNLNLPSKPWDTGHLNESEVIVSLPESKIIKSISLSELELGREFNTSKPCWCLFCTENEIYGCCGEEGSQGEVQIFAQNGLRKRCFTNKIPNTKIDGMRIFVKSKRIYATFAESKALHLINTETITTKSFEHRRLNSPRSVFVDSDDKIFISDMKRNTLQEFKIVDDVLVLLKNYDLELKPQHILERKSDNSLLLVGMSTGL